MTGEPKGNVGIQLLVEKYKKIFQIPENTKFYSDEDYLEAEKKFVKYSVFGRIHQANG